MRPGTKEQAAIYRLDKSDVYQHWRDKKLAKAARTADDLLVEIDDPGKTSEAEKAEILQCCRHNNMAVYNWRNSDADENTTREKIRSLADRFGLYRVETHRSMACDGLVSIEVIDNPQESRQGFIPYTDKAISWHTDGYYNPPSARIKAMILHCVRPAEKGGDNKLLDPEIAYIRLRDENPDYVRALSHRRALSIPAYQDAGGESRAQSVGPVFTWDRYTGDLHMRFTDRKRYIEWAHDNLTREAVEFLRNVLETDPHVIRLKMQAGQGLICNNVLHMRTAFARTDKSSQGRLLLRARYLDRIEGTTA